MKFRPAKRCPKCSTKIKYKEFHRIYFHKDIPVNKSKCGCFDSFPPLIVVHIPEEGKENFIKEHIRVDCRRCGYQWAEECAT